MGEPSTYKSVYELLNDALKIANRKTFVHRFIYTGETKTDKCTDLIFTDIVSDINDDYVEEPLTGLLLLYTNHFVHILDGSEDAIIKHFKMLFEKRDQFGKHMKVLIIYHHINQRMFDEWSVRRAKPPILLEKIDPNCDAQDMRRYLEMCIKKIYNLAIALRRDDPEHPNCHLIGEILSTYSQFLPEYNLLDFLLNNPDIMDVQILERLYFCNEEEEYERLHVWPVRTALIPFNIFEKEFNPIPHLFLPKEQ